MFSSNEYSSRQMSLEVSFPNFYNAILGVFGVVVCKNILLKLSFRRDAQVQSYINHTTLFLEVRERLV